MDCTIIAHEFQCNLNQNTDVYKEIEIIFILGMNLKMANASIFSRPLYDDLGRLEVLIAWIMCIRPTNERRRYTVMQSLWLGSIDPCHCICHHYDDVRMGAIASQITSLMIVYSIVYSDADQRKHQSSASLAFVRGIHRGPVNFPHKWPVTRKMFPLDDVIMMQQ